MNSALPWPADHNSQLSPGPAMPGHMHAPMPGAMPYPWMQRPMPGQMMPPMPGPTMQSPMARSWTPDMGPMDLWTMPQWNMQMWELDAEEDPQEMRDMEYWQQLYPEQTRRIQREVSHQCDLLDYEGSVMYDEYPDRIALARICESVYNALMQNGVIGSTPRPNQEFINGNNTDDDAMDGIDDMDDNNYTSNKDGRPRNGQNYEPIDSVDMMQYRRPGQRPPRTLQDLIEVLLYQEMHQRRRQRRRNRRWW